VTNPQHHEQRPAPAVPSETHAGGRRFVAATLPVHEYDLVDFRRPIAQRLDLRQHKRAGGTAAVDVTAMSLETYKVVGSRLSWRLLVPRPGRRDGFPLRWRHWFPKDLAYF